VKLLLAEDDVLQRKLLGRVLTRAGHDVETVTDGLEALQRLSAGDFRFLITDWDMPGMDGATLCREVRAAESTDYIYILMLTGHTTEADLLAAFEAGADDYVKKPASEAELLARVKAGCRLLESERSLRAALEQVQRLSVTDALTGTYNRRYLNEQLPLEIERAYRYGRALSIVMADLDGFKQINDRHGHSIGDEVLKCFSDRVGTSIRASSDWIGRYGGEEFVIVLPELEVIQAAAVAEKIRLLCDTIPMDTPSGQYPVTASFGAAGAPIAPDTAISAQALLRLADNALYRSKREGRNCVRVAG
jgi:two-component system cell cycle response regulator